MEVVVDDRDAASRRNAVLALGSISMTLLNYEGTTVDNVTILSVSEVHSIFDTFINAMDDYATDDRGIYIN